MAESILAQLQTAEEAFGRHDNEWAHVLEEVADSFDVDALKAAHIQGSLKADALLSGSREEIPKLFKTLADIVRAADSKKATGAPAVQTTQVEMPQVHAFRSLKLTLKEDASMPEDPQEAKTTVKIFVGSMLKNYIMKALPLKGVKALNITLKDITDAQLAEIEAKLKHHGDALVYPLAKTQADVERDTMFRNSKIKSKEELSNFGTVAGLLQNLTTLRGDSGTEEQRRAYADNATELLLVSQRVTSFGLREKRKDLDADDADNGTKKRAL